MEKKKRKIELGLNTLGIQYVKEGQRCNYLFSSEQKKSRDEKKEQKKAKKEKRKKKKRNFN